MKLIQNYRPNEQQDYHTFREFMKLMRQSRPGDLIEVTRHEWNVVRKRLGKFSWSFSDEFDYHGRIIRRPFIPKKV